MPYERPIVRIAKAIKGKIEQHKENKSKRVDEASSRLKERNISTLGLRPNQILKLNKKVTKSDVRQQTTSAMEEFQTGRAGIKAATGPKVDVDMQGSINVNADSGSSSTSSTSSTSSPSATGGSKGVSKGRPTVPRETNKPTVPPAAKEQIIEELGKKGPLPRRDLKRNEEALLKVKNPKMKTIYGKK